MAPTLRQKVNDYAIRVLRNTADMDYINARMSYRAQLIPNFHWSSLHCLEKYAKCILLISRTPRPKNDIRHEIQRSLNLISNTFDITLSNETLEFVKKLDEFSAKYRYLEISWSIHQHEIIELDRAVWEIRRYCNPRIYDHSCGSERLKLKTEMTKQLSDLENITDENKTIPNGYIEKILEDKNHPARQYLIWCNLIYSNSNRKTVSLPRYLMGENSPFYLFP